jgi:single-strand DNA-binding protein
MARGINKVILIGNLGKAPEAFNGGCRLALATDESYKDKNTGQMVPKTEWHNITMFGKLGDICLEYLAKGSKVYVEGRLQTDKYQKEGVDHYQTKIIANEMQMLDSKPQGSQQQAAQQPQQGYQNQPNPTYQHPQQRPQTSNQPNPRGLAPLVTDNFDDDSSIPF